jgi:hypothetical protein
MMKSTMQSPTSMAESASILARKSLVEEDRPHPEKLLASPADQLQGTHASPPTDSKSELAVFFASLFPRQAAYNGIVGTVQHHAR